jgi:hypothetical protein
LSNARGNFQKQQSAADSAPKNLAKKSQISFDINQKSSVDILLFLYSVGVVPGQSNDQRPDVTDAGAAPSVEVAD